MKFKLSDKVYDSFMLSLKKVIKVEDVKEFIKKLKEETYKKSKAYEKEWGLFCSLKEFKEIIDNLSGDLK